MSASDNLSPKQFDVQYNSTPRDRFDSGGLVTAKVDAKLSKKIMREPFLRGHCHALALAIHKEAGHPIGAVYTGNRDFPSHFFNYDKSNPKMGFDAHGHRPVTEIAGSTGKWNSETSSIDMTPNTHKEVTPEYVAKETSKEGWLPGHHEAATAIAPTILKSQKGKK